MDSIGKVQSRFLIVRAGMLALVTIFLFSCHNESRKRPYGYIRLGSLERFLPSEVEFIDERLVVRHDSKGLSVMSTMCTYDLTYLLRKNENGKTVYVSEYTASKYDSDGHVLVGPAKFDLPYYELKIDSGTYGGPKDTLYVRVGEEVPESWRLAIPQ